MVIYEEGRGVIVCESLIFWRRRLSVSVREFDSECETLIVSVRGLILSVKGFTEGVRELESASES